jgi:hypothetical protein
MPASADPDPTADVGGEPDEPVASLAEKVYLGTSGGKRSVVGIYIRSSCGTQCVSDDVATGTLVSGVGLVTAAHAVPTELLTQYAPNLFWGPVAVTYADPDTNATYCLTRTWGSKLGTCSLAYGSSDYRSMIMYLSPDFVGSHGEPQQTGHDIAVILDYTLGWPHEIADGKDYALLAYRSVRNSRVFQTVTVGDKFTVVGFGDSKTDKTGSGTLRYDPDLLDADWVGPEHFYNFAKEVRVCGGDSGSPALVFAKDGKAISIGVLSNVSDKIGTCATVNAKQRYALTAADIDWIQTTLSDQGATCVRKLGYAVSSTLGYDVLQCD